MLPQHRITFPSDIMTLCPVDTWIRKTIFVPLGLPALLLPSHLHTLDTCPRVRCDLNRIPTILPNEKF
jgi:hypothetical protein